MTHLTGAEAMIRRAQPESLQLPRDAMGNSPHDHAVDPRLAPLDDDP